MRVLITGAAGFIGRHFARHGAAVGWRMTLIDTSTTVHSILAHDPGSWFADDCDAVDFFRDRAGVGMPYDLVIHCAAQVGGRVGIERKDLLLAEDLTLDAEMFRWAARGGARRVVYFSSSAAYPTSLQGADAVDTLLESDIDLYRLETPDALYGWVKLTGEQLAQRACAAGVKVHVFRPFSGYGSDQSLDYPFPSFIDRAVRRADPFMVWGPGTQVRDFIHVDDVVGAVLAAVGDDEFGPMNLCTGVGTSFVELARLCCEEAGYSPYIKTDPSKPVGVRRRVGSPERMRRFYQPQVSLRQGVARALAMARPRVG